jgi:hypothetical protein
MSDFFLDGSVGNRLYRYLIDDSIQQACDARSFTNKLWECTSSYVGRDLQTNAKEQFHPCFWEMYLIAALLEQGFPVVKRGRRRCKRKGPDVQVGNLSAWFEAIAVTAGSGLDAVQELDPHSEVAIDVPQDKIKLRLMAAIQEKHSKYQTYRKNEIVKQGEPFIIALNAALIPHVQVLELTVPWIVKALFPIGHEVLQLNLNTRKVVDQYHDYQECVVKEKGTQIPTTFFEQPESEGISAVLYSTAHVFAYRELGADFKLVHNPQAATPLSKGFLKVGTEYWVEGDQLFCQEYSEW